MALLLCYLSVTYLQSVLSPKILRHGPIIEMILFKVWRAMKRDAVMILGLMKLLHKKLTSCMFFFFSDTSYVISQPKKVLQFEDAKQRAWQWKKAIEGLQNRWNAWFFWQTFFFGYYDSLEEQGCAPGNYYLMKEAGVCGFIFFKVQSSRPSRCLELSMR